MLIRIIALRFVLVLFGLFTLATSQTCVIVGNSVFGGFIGRSSSGGLDPWNITYLADANTLFSVTCTGNTCFSVGNAQTGSTPALASSSDDGYSWTVVWPPNPLYELSTVACAPFPSSICVAAGPRSEGFAAAYVTNDTGKSWTVVYPDAEILNGASCPSSGVCFLCGSDGAGADVFVLKSVDGGFTWTQVLLKNNGGAWLSDIACVSTTQCYACGIGDAFSGVIAQTMDGGSTWSVTNITGVVPLTAISCPTALTCFAVSSNISSLSPYDSRAFVQVTSTTDGGKSWTTTSLDIQGYAESITCTNADTCFIATVTTTQGGTVIRTLDGGASWKVIWSDLATGLYGISCLGQ